MGPGCHQLSVGLRLLLSRDSDDDSVSGVGKMLFHLMVRLWFRMVRVWLLLVSLDCSWQENAVRITSSFSVCPEMTFEKTTLLVSALEEDVTLCSFLAQALREHNFLQDRHMHSQDSTRHMH